MTFIADEPIAEKSLQSVKDDQLVLRHPSKGLAAVVRADGSVEVNWRIVDALWEEPGPKGDFLKAVATLLLSIRHGRYKEL